MAPIGSTSPEEMLGVVLVTVVAILIVSVPVVLATGGVELYVDGVEESDVFTSVERQTSQTPFGRITLTIHLARGAPVQQVSSSTVTGQNIDSERLKMTTTTVKIGCKRGDICVIRATNFKGEVISKIAVTVKRDGPL